MVSKKMKAWEEAGELGLTKDLVYDEVTRSEIEEIIEKKRSESIVPEYESEEEITVVEEEEVPVEDSSEESEEDEEESEEEDEEPEVEFIEEDPIIVPLETPVPKKVETTTISTSSRLISRVRVVKKKITRKPKKKKRNLSRYFPKKSKILKKY